jgi:site-specific DNA recombinase
MIQAIGYIRVSKEIQAEEGSSLESQKDYLMKYAELNNIKLMDIISDEGISAYNRKVKRPGFTKVMEYVTQQRTEAVIIYSISRFARNTSQLLEAVETMKNNRVQFHSVKEKLDTSSAIGVFFLTIVGALAQLESGQTSERIKDVKKVNKWNRKTYTGFVYGFTNDTVSHTMVPVPYELEIVKQIKYMRETMPLRKIAEALNETGVPTKKPGSKWHNSQISSILNNPIYK